MQLLLFNVLTLDLIGTGLFKHMVHCSNQKTGSAAARVYVPTDFDTIEKAFSVAKAAEKGLK